jgi:hypothetical protein
LAQVAARPEGSLVEITWRMDKELQNIRKHGLHFALAKQVLTDPLSYTQLDRIVYGEERWHTIGAIVVGRRFRIVVVIHTYPDPDDDSRVHVISLREATVHERKRYEISRF